MSAAGEGLYGSRYAAAYEQGEAKVYILEQGKQATELVDIFAEARPEQVGTVDEQQRFRQQWITSLKEKIQ